MKKGLILSIFTLIFLSAFSCLYIMRKTPTRQNPSFTAETVISDSLHSYTEETLNNECSQNDQIFCAIELAVKCTINPGLTDCTKETVPAFILSRPDVTTRPSEIAFAITKIKPLPKSTDIYVYTKSDCNETWFGLCQGTVVYALTPYKNGWAVTNIYALEN